MYVRVGIGFLDRAFFYLLFVFAFLSLWQLLPWLERFDLIYLWLDDDKAGRDGCEKLVGKLGRGRCRIVRPLPAMYRDNTAPKDANEALVKKLDLTAMLAAAAPTPHEQIVRFQVRSHAGTRVSYPVRQLACMRSNARGEALLVTWGGRGCDSQDLQEEVFRELSDPGSVSGTPFRSLPTLQKLLKVLGMVVLAAVPCTTSFTRLCGALPRCAGSSCW